MIGTSVLVIARSPDMLHRDTGLRLALAFDLKPAVSAAYRQIETTKIWTID
jgi:hypothetical protein